uniref:Uncharacterized protein n=1 Tax=Glossina palpalis gambiensis TaxID=67801 RepID=A0A1B0AYX0_9MUSC
MLKQQRNACLNTRNYSSIEGFDSEAADDNTNKALSDDYFVINYDRHKHVKHVSQKHIVIFSTHDQLPSRYKQDNNKKMQISKPTDDGAGLILPELAFFGASLFSLLVLALYSCIFINSMPNTCPGRYRESKKGVNGHNRSAAGLSYLRRKSHQLKLNASPEASQYCTKAFGTPYLGLEEIS